MEPGSFLRVDLPVFPSKTSAFLTALSGPQLLLVPNDGSEGTDLPYSQRPQGSESYPGSRWPLLRESGEELSHTEMGLDQAPNHSIVISLPWALCCFEMI